MTINQKETDILETALELFAQYGFHFVGVDRIIAQSGVAKMTFYKYFPSKDMLIERVLEKRNKDLQEEISVVIDKAKTPQSKIKSIFTWYENWFNSPSFHGCMFIKAAEEFHGKKPKVNQVAQSHKSWLTNKMRCILDEQEIKDSKSISTHFMIILDGLTVNRSIQNKAGLADLKTTWKYAQMVMA